MRKEKDRQCGNTDGERWYINQMNHINYTTRQVACIALGIVFLLISMFVIIEIRTEPGQIWDVECPMANAAISWQQTFYSGAPGVN